MEWRPAVWSVCLLLLIFPCSIKSRSSLLAPAHPGGPGKRAVKRMWCGDGCGVILLFPPEVENHFAEKVQHNHIFSLSLS